MERIAKTISELLLENNIIPENDIEIYKYGLELFLTSVLEVSAILLASIFIGNFCETLIFLITFLPVRIYSGGYHADTRGRCFMVLIGVYILFSIILLLDVSSIYKYFMIPFSILTIFCIYKWAPLQHNNKLIQEQIKNKFKHISMALSVVECFIVILINVFNIYNKLSIAFYLGLLTVLISLIAGKIKKFLTEGEKQ